MHCKASRLGVHSFYLVLSHWNSKNINIIPLRLLKHGYAEKSFLKYGLEEIADVLPTPLRTPNFDVLNFCHIVS